MARKSALILIVAAGLFILAACGPKGPEKLSVTTSEFMYDPMAWSVSAGRDVEFTITNNGTLDHEWVIIKKGMEVTLPFDDDDEDKVFWEIEASPGETKTETFTAPSEAGDYTIVCGTPAHLEAGMKGSLTVK